MQVFSGNRDAISVVYNKLSQPITTHFVRILPVQWNNYGSMAVEIYGCQGTYVDLYQNQEKMTGPRGKLRALVGICHVHESYF